MKIDEKYDFFKAIMKRISSATDTPDSDQDEIYTKALSSLYFETVYLDIIIHKYCDNPEALLADNDEIFDYHFQLVQFVREQTLDLSELSTFLFSDVITFCDLVLPSLDLLHLDSRINSEYGVDDRIEYNSLFLIMYRRITSTMKILLEIYNILFNTDTADYKSIADCFNKILYTTFSLMKDCHVLGNHLYIKFKESLDSTTDTNSDM